MMTAPLDAVEDLFRCGMNWLWCRERKSGLITAVASGY